MSMRKHKPVPISKMKKRRHEGKMTICQILRNIYAMTNNEEIKMKCRIGTSMAKSMNKRLLYYKETYGEMERKKNESV